MPGRLFIKTIAAAETFVCVCVCVFIDYEAMLNMLIEALAQLTHHINILYTLVQSLMDDTST